MLLYVCMRDALFQFLVALFLWMCRLKPETGAFLFQKAATATTISKEGGGIGRNWFRSFPFAGYDDEWRSLLRRRQHQPAFSISKSRSTPSREVRGMSGVDATPFAGWVRLHDGTTELPYDASPVALPLDLVVGHGLGSDPASKSHRDDVSTDVFRDALAILRRRSSPHETTDASATGANEGDDDDSGTCVFYTARGHGASRGWDDVHATPSDFRWENLSGDMISVAESALPHLRGGPRKKFVAAGQSMGAASALYLAMAEPRLVDGLVLMRPPRAWDERRRAASGFVADADALRRAEGPGSSRRHLVLRGAAETDLPPRDDGRYRAVRCPVLVLSHDNDPNHPVETGRALYELMPHATLEIATDEGEARRDWPGVVAGWLEKVVRLDRIRV